MKKFMVLYLAPMSAEEQMAASRDPAEAKKGMEMWMAWFQKGGKAIVDAGTPLGKGANMTKSSSSKPKSQVSGYTIVEAKDIDEVKGMTKNHPHFMMPMASIEILEMLPMNM